jgi:hypothetical protein
MSIALLLLMLLASLGRQDAATLTPDERVRMDAQNTALRAELQQATKLAFASSPIPIQAPAGDGAA